MRQTKLMVFIFELALCTFMVSCAKDDDPQVTSISLSQPSLSIIKEGTATLSVSHTPSNLTAPDYVWSSSNTSVATVNHGVISAVNEGTAIITASVTKLNLYAACTVIVTPIVPTSITLDKSNLSLIVGDESKLTAIVLPENAKNKSFSWSSSNEKIISISNDGIVKSIAPGNAKITVKTTIGNLEATCDVEVKKIPVESVSLNYPKLNMIIGQTETLTATIYPSNATYKDLEWSSSDESIATVTEGKIVTFKEGTISISVKTADENKTASCIVTVNNNNNVDFNPYGNDSQW